MSVLQQAVQVDPFAELSRFRADFYDCLNGRRDALFELADAPLCTKGPVRTLVDLALCMARSTRDAWTSTGCGARSPVCHCHVPPTAAWSSPWLRPDAATCPDRSLCHTYGRGDAKHQMIPGWPYSVVAALEKGRTSWTAILDSVRLKPGADLAAVTTGRLHDVIEFLVAAGQWREGDPEICRRRGGVPGSGSSAQVVGRGRAGWISVHALAPALMASASAVHWSGVTVTMMSGRSRHDCDQRCGEAISEDSNCGTGVAATGKAGCTAQTTQMSWSGT